MYISARCIYVRQFFSCAAIDWLSCLIVHSEFPDTFLACIAGEQHVTHAVYFIRCSDSGIVSRL